MSARPEDLLTNLDTEDFEKRLFSIISRAKDENRALTSEEVDECNRIKDEWIRDKTEKAARDLQSTTKILPRDSPDTALAKMETVKSGTSWLQTFFARIKETLNRIFSNLGASIRRGIERFREQLADFFSELRTRFS